MNFEPLWIDTIVPVSYTHLWNGGYVEGWGYIGNDVNAFSGVGEYCTFPEYLRSSSNDLWNIFVDKVVAMVLTKIHKGLPVVKDYTDYLEKQINQVHNDCLLYTSRCV